MGKCPVAFISYVANGHESWNGEVIAGVTPEVKGYYFKAPLDKSEDTGQIYQCVSPEALTTATARPLCIY